MLLCMMPNSTQSRGRETYVFGIFYINEFDPGPGLKRGTNDDQHDTPFCPDPMNTPRDAHQLVAWEANE